MKQIYGFFCIFLEKTLKINDFQQSVPSFTQNVFSLFSEMFSMEDLRSSKLLSLNKDGDFIIVVFLPGFSISKKIFFLDKETVRIAEAKNEI